MGNLVASVVSRYGRQIVTSSGRGHQSFEVETLIHELGLLHLGLALPTSN